MVELIVGAVLVGILVIGMANERRFDSKVKTLQASIDKSKDA